MKRTVALLCLSVSLTACALASSDPSAEPVGAAEQGVTEKPFRVVAANLSSGRNQSYDPGEGARILTGLAPDLVLIQELNVGDNQPASVASWVTSTLGAGYTYAREEHAAIPNGVISRYPIRESGTWDDPSVANRSFVWAKIDVPGDKDLLAVSVHWHTGGTASRLSESRALLDHLHAVSTADDLIVVGGDMNSGSFGEPSLKKLEELVSDGATPPEDSGGNRNTNASRNKPYDHVMLSAPLLAAQVPTVVGGLSFPSGLVFDSRKFPDVAAKVPPVRKTDSAAKAMQHMAVVRDIALH